MQREVSSGVFEEQEDAAMKGRFYNTVVVYVVWFGMLCSGQKNGRDNECNLYENTKFDVWREIITSLLNKK